MEFKNEVEQPDSHSEAKANPAKASAGKRNGLVVQDVGRYIRYTLFLVGIGLLYIWNSHVAESQVRKENHLKSEIADAKAEYKTVHARLDAGTRQSTIFEKVDSLGLKATSRNIYKLSRKAP
ncbi:MAG: FtsL-like putative cell division protein [Bacteroidota bacterium]